MKLSGINTEVDRTSLCICSHYFLYRALRVVTSRFTAVTLPAVLRKHNKEENKEENNDKDPAIFGTGNVGCEQFSTKCC